MKVEKKQEKIQTSTEYLKDIIIDGIRDKKGEEIVSLDLQEIQESVTDYFIICHASSTTQVKAIADHILKKVKDTIDEIPWHKEGLTNLEWVLIDYVSVVVHIFLKDKREFYNIEELWADAEVIEHND